MALRKHIFNIDHSSDTDDRDETDDTILNTPSTEASPPIDAANPTNFRIGEILKRERERRGYDLQQIADYLCIRRGLLEAIEKGNYEEFQADAYVIGFLRSYAEIIGLNGQEAINVYRKEMVGRRKKPRLSLPTPTEESQAPTAVLMGCAALASLLIYIGWYVFSTNERATVTKQPELPVTAAPVAPAAAAPEAVAPAPTAALAPSATTPALSTSVPASGTTAATPSPGISISAPPPTDKPLAAPAPLVAPTSNDDAEADDATKVNPLPESSHKKSSHHKR